MKMRLMVAGLALALSGCGTVGGWFGSGPAKAKPAELVEFKPTASLDQAWKVETGDTAGHLFHPQAEGDDVFAAGGKPADPPVDVTALHAKIGEITLENDFLERALTKAGWLSAKR